MDAYYCFVCAFLINDGIPNRPCISPNNEVHPYGRLYEITDYEGLDAAIHRSEGFRGDVDQNSFMACIDNINPFS